MNDIKTTIISLFCVFAEFGKDRSEVVDTPNGFRDHNGTMMNNSISRFYIRSEIAKVKDEGEFIQQLVEAEHYRCIFGTCAYLRQQLRVKI